MRFICSFYLCVWVFSCKHLSALHVCLWKSEAIGSWVLESEVVVYHLICLMWLLLSKHRRAPPLPPLFTLPSVVSILNYQTPRIYSLIFNFQFVVAATTQRLGTTFLQPLFSGHLLSCFYSHMLLNDGDTLWEICHCTNIIECTLQP